MSRTALKLCTALVMVGGLAVPVAGNAANYVKAAQDALAKGDLKTAEIELRNAVRDDPQNAALRFNLAEVEFRLADPQAAERDARAAETRGFDPHKTQALIGEAMLSEGRGKDLLAQMHPGGKDPQLDAEIDMLRGQAQLQLGNRAGAKASYAEAERVYPAAASAWVADARLALSEGDMAAAKEKLDRALAEQPKLEEAQVLKAAVMAQSGDRPGAIALLDKLIKDQPPAAMARAQRATLLLSEGKVDDAEKDVNAILRLTPGNVQALYLRADILHAQKKNVDALAVLQKLQPTFDAVPRGYLLMAVVAQANGQPQIAEENAAKYIARVPQDVTGYSTLAQLYLANRRPDLALQPLNQAVQAGKTNAAIYQMLGQAEMAVQRPDLASNAFAKLRELVPDNLAVITESAAALQASGHPDQGFDLLHQAFLKNPKVPQLQDAMVSAALASGNVAKAQAALDEVKKAAGDSPGIENLTAVVQIAALDPAAAVQTLEPVVKANPDLAVARLNLARAYSLLGDGQKAEQELQAVLQSHPAAEPALSILVENAERRNDTAQAIALLEKAHAAVPKNDVLTVQLGGAYLRANQPQKALDLAQAAQQADGHPTAPILDLTANAEVALKHFDDARATYTQLLTLEPAAVNVRNQYAALLVNRKDYETARNVLSQGMAATPRNYQLELNYALVDLKDGGIDKALHTADNLQQQDRAFAPLAALKGDIYMADNKPQDAATAYQQALAKTPTAFLAMRLAGAYSRLGETGKARTVLADWVAQHPTDHAVLAQLSEIDIALKDYKSAQSELNTLVTANPRNADLVNNLAWVDQQLGDSQALPLAEKAYLLSQSPQTADTLGWILTQQGNAAKGVELLRQAVASGDPRIAYHLAVALKDTGNKDEAVKLLSAVSKTQGTFTEKADAEKLLGEMTKGS